MLQSMKCQDRQITTTMASSVSSSKNKLSPVKMTLITADLKQQQSNRDEIYNNFEYDRDVPDQDSNSLVANFYNGRNVFITGASGFVGKVRLQSD